MTEIRIRRGPASQLPADAAAGEPLLTTDTHNIYVGGGPGVMPVKVTGVTYEVQAALAMKANAVDLGTAAAKDVPATGNASAGQVVLGNDTRLSDSRITQATQAALDAKVDKDSFATIATQLTSGDITSDVAAALVSSSNVYIPSGTFTTTGGWVVRPGCTLSMANDTVINATSTTAPVIQIRTGATVTGGNLYLPAGSTTASGIYINGKDPLGYGVSNFTIRDLQIYAPYNSYAGNAITIDVSDPTGTGSNCYVAWGTVDNVKAWYTDKGVNVIAPSSNTGAWTSSVGFNSFFAWRNTYAVYLPSIVQNYTFSKPQTQWGASAVNAFFIDGLYNVIDAPMMWDYPSTAKPLVLGPNAKHNTVSLAYGAQKTQVFDQGSADNSITNTNGTTGLNSPAGNFNYIRDNGSTSPGTPVFYGNQDDILAYADKHYTVTTTGTVVAGSIGNVFTDSGYVIFSDPSASQVQYTINLGTSQNITTIGMNFYSGLVPADFTIEYYDTSWHTVATVIDNRNSKYVLPVSGYGTPMSQMRVTVTKTQTLGSVNPNTYVALSRIWATSNELGGHMYPTRMGGHFYGPVTFDSTVSGITQAAVTGLKTTDTAVFAGLTAVNSAGNVSVFGQSDTNFGGFFQSTSGDGAKGITTSGNGLYGQTTSGFGVFGRALGGFSGVFYQMGTLTGNSSSNTVLIKRQPDGAHNVTGNVLQISDDPTVSGTVSGALISGEVDSTEKVRFDPRVSAGPSAVAHFLDTKNTLSAPARLLSVRNNGTEKFSVDASGNITATNIGTAASLNATNVVQLTGNGSLPSYASNAAAVTGGLAVGTLYRQGDFVAVVH